MWGSRSRSRFRLALAVVCAGALFGVNEPTGDAIAAPDALVVPDPGRALRAAAAAIASGNRARADELLRAVADRHPIIADHADLLRMRMLVQAGDADAAIDEEPRWIDRDSPLRARFYTLLGEAQRAKGDEEKARAAFEFAVAGTRERSRIAELDLAIADFVPAQRRARARGRAAARRVDAQRDLPQAKQADDRAHAARGRARTLAAQRARDARSRRPAVRQQSQRGALAAYDARSRSGSRSATSARAQQRRAETLFRLRRYEDAIDAYRALPRARSARSSARARRRAQGACRRARARSRRSGASGAGARACEALYLAAVLWDGERRARPRARSVEQVIQRLPRSVTRRRRAGRSGWSGLIARSCSTRRPATSTRSRRAIRPGVGSCVPRLLAGSAVRELPERAGTVASATPSSRANFPFTYYGWLGGSRARRARRGEAARASRRAAGRCDPSSSRGAHPARGRARQRARRGARAAVRRSARSRDRLAPRAVLPDAGDFSNAQRWSSTPTPRSSARGPAPGDVELWWHAWPAPYETELQKATRDGGRPPRELVYSIMREESGYRPDVISVSGARGLLQLMPDTATRVARSVNLDPFEPGDLFKARGEHRARQRLSRPAARPLRRQRGGRDRQLQRRDPKPSRAGSPTAAHPRTSGSSRSRTTRRAAT
jgi:soluble lytic murein transglycosylase